MPTDSPSDVRPRPEGSPEIPLRADWRGHPDVAGPWAAVLSLLRLDDRPKLATLCDAVASLPRVGPSLCELCEKELEESVAQSREGFTYALREDGTFEPSKLMQELLDLRARSHPTGLREQADLPCGCHVEVVREPVVRYTVWCDEHFVKRQGLRIAGPTTLAVLRLLDGGSDAR